MAPIEWELHKSYGTRSPWVARISGTDAHYGLDRDFLARAAYKASRSGRTADVAYEIDAPGLYEVGSAGDHNGFSVIWAKGDRLVYRDIDDDRAHDIAERMSAGEDFDAARLATRPAAN